MSDVQTSSPRARRSRLLVAVRAFLVVVAVLAVAVAALYLARKIVARQVLVGWLDERGVRADVDIQRLDATGVVARVHIGDADNPDFSAERVEVDYGLRGFWAPRGLGADVRQVRLVHPVLRARLHDGRFSLGSLDRLVEELLKQPPRPDATKPLVLVEGGRGRLDTDYGTVAIQADARIEDAKLIELSAKLGPTALRGEDLQMEIAGGALLLKTQADRVDVSLQADMGKLAYGASSAQGVHIALKGQGPYPDMEQQRGDGALSLDLTATANTAQTGESSAQAISARARFEGQVAGWIQTVSLAGPLQASVTAGALESSDGRLSHLEAGFGGQARWSRTDWRLQGTSSATARGSWKGLGAPSRGEPVELASLKRAAADFRLAAPAVAVSAGPEVLRAGLPAPVRIEGANGLSATIAARNGKPVFADDGGAFDLTLRGGSFPTTEASIIGYTLRPDGLAAQIAAQSAGSFGPVRQAKVKTAGRATLRNGVLAYVASACEPIEIGRLDFGANDARDLKGQLCPGATPLLRIADGAWSTSVRLTGTEAAAPFLQARATEVDATVAAQGKGSALAVNADISRARLSDTSEPLRFYPVSATGKLGLKADRLRGDFVLADRGGLRLGKATLDQDLARGAGGVRLDTGVLEFNPEGLQPAALSPMASALASPVVGKASFEGGVRWSGDDVTSDGLLKTPSLDFKSVAGAVVGLSGEVRFTSLVPLVTAPNQRLHVDHIDSMASLSNVAVDFQIVDDALKIASGNVDVGGGVLRLEPLTAPLDGSAFEGAVDVDGVQLSGIVAKSPFADRVSLEAKVSGKLPFVLGPEGIRFIDGRLEAIEPGRLSIRREALVTVASGGGEATVANAPQALQPETNTVTEFAFQALEHLAFDSLSAEVNSLPQGRLGVLFKINGAYEPPQEQTLELGLRDLLRKDLLQRRLPLPSHTKVNLTLDTTLNLDQLLHDFAETQRTGSAPVQP